MPPSDTRTNPRATATRAVTGLADTSTIRTRPSAIGMREQRRATRLTTSMWPLARKNDRLSKVIVRSMLFSLTCDGTRRLPGEKLRIARTPAATTASTRLLRRVGRYAEHGDVDLLAFDEALEFARVANRHAAARVLPDLLARGVEQRHDIEAVLAEAGIVGQRQPEVAGADDDDLDAAVQPEDLAQVALQILDVVADAANAELAEMREVLANLRRIELELRGQLLRRHRVDAAGIQRFEAPQIHRQPGRRELRHLVAASPVALDVGHGTMRTQSKGQGNCATSSCSAASL